MVRALGWVVLAGCAVGHADENVSGVVGAIPLTDGFDYPVGAPDAVGYRNAQGFGDNHHLGDDWNGLGGGNSDLGDPVYSVGHGRVTAVGHRGPGWGNVVRIAHRFRGDYGEQTAESFYAHLDTMTVEVGDLVYRGQPIGTIGTADGAWFAHLHFELRTQVGEPDGRGYGAIPRGWWDPSALIAEHRPSR